MTGKGSITHAPNRRLRWMLAAHLLWIGLVFVLGAWWGKLVLIQAERISQLEQLAGLAADAAETHWVKTQRMLYWESIAFFVLLIVGTVLISWFYWRDLKRVRSLQAFFASLTHELRTPLTSIRLQAESIAEGLSRESGERPLVERLLEDTTRLESQVERTLELARVEGGGAAFNQPVRLRPFIERLLKNWKESYGNKIEVETRIPESLVVQADVAAMQVIFKNLLENAIRHGNPETQGKVRVLLSIGSRPQSSSHVTVSFKDDGSGFDGETSRLGKIFEKGPTSQGAGVGLYLVRVLMERMGGRAEFKGVDGFEVLLSFKEGHADG